MSIAGLIVCGVVIAFGLVGCIIQLYPGGLVIAITIGIWAAVESVAAAWITFGLAALLTAASTALKFLLPARRMKRQGVDTMTLLIGAVAGILGFFALPVIGLPIGFILGIYGRELARHSHEEAMRRTKIAIRGVGLSIAIEFAAGLAAAIMWLIGVLVIHL